MEIIIKHKGQQYSANLSEPHDISITLTDSESNPVAWYLDRPRIEPVVMGDWIGKVSEGTSSTNFNNIYFNPHGHGTHTECVGHITTHFYSVNSSLRTFFFTALLISVRPEKRDEDLVISLEQIKRAVGVERPESLVIRTLPNSEHKRSAKYSNTNPPYLDHDAARWMNEIGIKHLLIDLPSVDRENDEGKLLAHKAFWNVKDIVNLNADARLEATITELVYIPDTITDGLYLLNLQIASFENDASPSKPVLYNLTELI